MNNQSSALEGWTPEQIAQAKRWVENWKEVGPILEQMRREELKRVDTFRAVESLCGPVDFSLPPFKPKPTSGLIEQQAWFRKLK